MSSPFTNSLFHQLVFQGNRIAATQTALLGGVSGSSFAASSSLRELDLVVFDFETTGLDVKTCRIIEIGAVKFRGGKEVARMSTFLDPGIPIGPEITSITGITPEMLAGAPTAEKVLPEFHDFLRGCVGVAHNAEFDCGMLVHESARLGIKCAYTVLCTLKLARALVKSERKNLDALAQHFGLSFESRHRSIGDILVTSAVLWRILDENPQLITLADLHAYQEFAANA